LLQQFYKALPPLGKEDIDYLLKSIDFTP